MSKAIEHIRNICKTQTVPGDDYKWIDPILELDARVKELEDKVQGIEDYLVGWKTKPTPVPKDATPTPTDIDDVFWKDNQDKPEKCYDPTAQVMGFLRTLDTFEDLLKSMVRK